MNQREWVAIVAALLFIALVMLAARAIGRRSRDEAWMIPSATTVAESAPLAIAQCQYVSTVYANEPLRRFGGKPLLFRGNAAVSIFDSFVLVERDAEQPLQISLKDIVEVGRASASVDRGVELNGLLSLTWLANGTPVTTNLRLNARDDNAQFQNTLSSLIAREMIR